MSEKSLSDSAASSGAIPPKATGRPARKSGRLWLWIGVAVAAIVLIAAALWFFRPKRTSSSGVTAKVVRGDLVISLTERGELEAKKRKVIRNDLLWPVIIKRVVPAGASVRKGDVIIEFECKELIEAIEKQKLQVAKSDADYEDARSNLELKKKEVAVNIHNAEEAVVDAEAALLRYKNGEWPVKQDDAESDIKLAKRDLALAQDKLNFKIKANEDPELKSPYSENEIEAEKLKVDRLELALKKAISRKKMLIDYDHPRELRRLNLSLENAGIDFERSKYDAEKQMRKAETLEKSRKTTLEMHRKKLTELEEDAGKLIVLADTEGLVLYNTGRGRRQAEIIIDVGEKISPRQQLLIIPDMTTLQVSTKVHESRISEVHKGIEAYITLGAKSDVTLAGKVLEVGAVPSPKHRWLAPDVKVFDVSVGFEDPLPGGVKPDTTANVTLILAVLKDVLQVPVAAVFTEQEQTYCWVVEAGRPKRREISAGRMSDTMVEIVSGLKEGEKVLLAPPPGELGRKKQKKPSAKLPGVKKQPEQKATPPAKPAPGGQPGDGRSAPKGSGPRPTRRPTGAPSGTSK